MKLSHLINTVIPMLQPQAKSMADLKDLIKEMIGDEEIIDEATDAPLALDTIALVPVEGQTDMIQIVPVEEVLKADEEDDEDEDEDKPKKPVVGASLRRTITRAVDAAMTKHAKVHKRPANQGIENKGTIIPASVKRFGKLRNFKGPDADVKAYRFGVWCMAAMGRSKSMERAENLGLRLKLSSESDNQYGGFLVPEEFGTDLIDLREEYGVFRPNARPVAMASDTKTNPRRAGGLTAYFVGEGEAGTESTKTWNQVRLTAKKLQVLSRYTNELNDDSVINIGDDLAGEIAYAFSLKEDQCGFLGDGTSTYDGIYGTNPKIKALGTATAGPTVVIVGATQVEVTLAEFNAVVGTLPQYADTPNAK